MRGLHEYDINILMDDFDPQNIDDVSQVGCLDLRVNSYAWEDLRGFTQTTGPSLLERKDIAASVTVKSFVLESPFEVIIGAEIRAKMAENPPPPGVTISYEGDLKAKAKVLAAC
ncbi:MAG: efflux RND transporter permease subunit [Haliscomenobacter sp.]|nr:hypothetical protein [Haliscomenobacter sp.]MBK9492314.1 efflux RND transporter permease subunit [Haliscomenobacter sp.]